MPSGEWVFEQADALLDDEQDETPRESEFDSAFAFLKVDAVTS